MPLSTKDFLLQCGVRPDLQGYYYLADLIERRREWLRSKEKENWRLMAEIAIVAKDYKGVSDTQIERCCRHAIEKCYDKAITDNAMIHLFDGVVDPDKGKPTNNTFICTAAEYLEHISRGL